MAKTKEGKPIKHKCPLCDGSGEIEMELRPTKDVIKKAAAKMNAEGFTVREIMKTLGFKNPGSVSHLLNKKS